MTAPALRLIAALASIACVSCAVMKPVPPDDDLGPAVTVGGSGHAIIDRAAPADVPLEWRSGEALIVHPVINGVEAGAFVLDTGATGMLITSDGARRTGLEPIGSTRLQDGSTTTVYRSDSFRLGPLELVDTTYAGADFPFAWLAFGSSVHGICGYDIFAHAIVEIDVATPMMRIYDPATYVLPSGRWRPLVLEANLPHVWCRFEGDHVGLFLLDAGFGESVWFFEHAVEEYGLLDGRKTRSRRILNFGASTEVRHGPLGWFEIGGLRINDTTADFSVSKMRVYPGPPEVLGIVGMEILARFRIVFDYPNGRVAFLPVE